MNIQVKGGQVISGEITPSGSKNSAVALLPATILFDKPVTLHNVPEITDMNRLVAIMAKLGSKIDWDKKSMAMKVDNSKLSLKGLGREDLGNMRGTSLLWGPMLARFKKVTFEELPGGCTLGFRTLGPHYKAFEDLGVTVVETANSVSMDARNAKSATILLSEMSPTATENAIMFATGLHGTTKIMGAASEPQVQDMCLFLSAAGVKIKGIGSNILEVEGVDKLKPIDHKLLSDHYEIATFVALAALTGGELKINDAIPEIFLPILRVFISFGVEVNYRKDTAYIKKGTKIRLNLEEGRSTLVVKAQPWPALPVDLLPIFIPLALAAKEGQVLFHNWMYDAGLFWTSELTKLGGNIIMCDPHRVIVASGNPLHGATLEAPYIIRAVVAMVMVAMTAKGESTILNADALYRGHPHFSENLSRLGADIKEV